MRGGRRRRLYRVEAAPARLWQGHGAPGRLCGWTGGDVATRLGRWGAQTTVGLTTSESSRNSRSVLSKKNLLGDWLWCSEGGTQAALQREDWEEEGPGARRRRGGCQGQEEEEGPRGQEEEGGPQARSRRHPGAGGGGCRSWELSLWPRE